jgi:hypothetical protein
MDAISDFQVAGYNRDRLDLTQLLDYSTFTGTTAAEAISGGYIKLVQQGTSTIVEIDMNGHAPGTGDYAGGELVELANVSKHDLLADIVV